MEHPENDDLYKGLKVNKGVADVPTVNSLSKKKGFNVKSIRLPSLWKAS